MTLDGSDFTALLPQLGAAFEYYHHHHHASIGVEIMKLNKETDEMSMETVHIALLCPAAHETLRKLLPIMHKAETRAILLDVLQETTERMEAQEDDENPSQTG